MSNLLKILAEDDCNYIKLKEDKVKTVAKNIASILYSSLSTKNVTDSNERLNVLLLLQKLCINEQNHFNVNESNYDCFLKTVPKRNNSLDFHTQVDATNTSSSILDYLSKLARFNTDIAKHQDLIQKYDLKNLNIDFTCATMRQCVSVYNGIEALEFINEQSSCAPITKPRRCVTVFHQVPNQNKISYALLNLDHPSAIEMLSEVLLALVQREHLIVDEVEFLNYVWANLERIDLKTQTLLIDNFKFILESSLIKLCTNVLRANNYIPPNITKLFVLCGNNPKLCCIVKSVLYTLFSYSGYNKALLKIIEMI